MTSRSRSWLGRVERNFLLGPPPVRPRQRPQIAEPGERARMGARRRRAASLAAIVLPVGTAVALLPARADHSQITAVVLVLPVVAVAILGASGPALIAAAVAGLAYDVLHTRPYGHVVIDDPDDVVTTVALVAVAVAVGGLCSRIVRLRARDTGRGIELQHLTEFARTAASSAAVDVLTGEACRHLVALLDLRHGRWHAGYHGQAAPTLLPDGRVTGYDGADQARLPPDLELPAVVDGRELGRFVVCPRGESSISAEERLTAATIVAVFASSIDRRR